MKRFLLPWSRYGKEIFQTEVLVLGSGIAGLYTAIKASNTQRVTVITKKTIEESNTGHAQGGIAVAMDEEDSPALHYEDTILAGAGLCDQEAVRILVEEGPARVEELIGMGAQFDQHGGALAFTREAAHSRRRILHAQGDATGWEIERALIQETRQRPTIEVKERRFLIDLLQDRQGKIAGALILNTVNGKYEVYLAKAVVLATGGLGQIFGHTTNPDVATADGMAAAWRAGVELMDMEFVQFHPTALLLPGAPRFLISEAVRGEGAHLINQSGKRFMSDVPGQELAPRDVVARAIWSEMTWGTVLLDFRPIGSEKIAERFPSIREMCLKYGYDVLTEPVPVAPAAHYMMGGIRTNIYGETSMENLYACGECACNGVHGANRLASNSLLDGLVFGARIVEKINQNPYSDLPDWNNLDLTGWEDSAGSEELMMRSDLQKLMWEKVGILREEKNLNEAVRILESLQNTQSTSSEISSLELTNMIQVSHIIAKSALARQESRGGHFRSDYPLRLDPGWQNHSVIGKGDNRVRYASV